MDELLSGRRELLITPLLAALPLALASEPARADKLNPDWTIVRRPDEIKLQSQAEFSQGVETAPLFGSINEPGLYFILVKWHPVATALRTDITAVYEFDPSCERFIEPFLYFKGFHAIQAHRLNHWLWVNGERDFCGYLQSRSSEVFQTDIHPAAWFGQGIFLDHATGLSAPHSYATDRLCVGVSGTWWVNSGADFEPENTRPAASSAVSPALGITTA